MSFIKFFFIVVISIFGFTNVNANPGGGHGGGQGKGNSMSHGGGHGHGVGHGVGHGASNKVNHGVSHANKAAVNKFVSAKNVTRFSTTDRTAITNFYNKNPSEKALPPGIAMNLARGKPLPPGIAKRNFPNDLLSTLPKRPGYEYVLVGKDAVLVDERTQIVTDILSNVLK